MSYEVVNVVKSSMDKHEIYKALIIYKIKAMTIPDYPKVQLLPQRPAVEGQAFELVCAQTHLAIFRKMENLLSVYDSTLFNQEEFLFSMPQDNLEGDENTQVINKLKQALEDDFGVLLRDKESININKRASLNWLTDYLFVLMMLPENIKNLIGLSPANTLDILMEFNAEKIYEGGLANLSIFSNKLDEFDDLFNQLAEVNTYDKNIARNHIKKAIKKLEILENKRQTIKDFNPVLLSILFPELVKNRELALYKNYLELNQSDNLFELSEKDSQTLYIANTFSSDLINFSLNYQRLDSPILSDNMQRFRLIIAKALADAMQCSDALSHSKQDNQQNIFSEIRDCINVANNIIIYIGNDNNLVIENVKQYLSELVKRFGDYAKRNNEVKVNDYLRSFEAIWQRICQCSKLLESKGALITAITSVSLNSETNPFNNHPLILDAKQALNDVSATSAMLHEHVEILATLRNQNSTLFKVDALQTKIKEDIDDILEGKDKNNLSTDIKSKLKAIKISVSSQNDYRVLLEIEEKIKLLGNNGQLQNLRTVCPRVLSPSARNNTSSPSSPRLFKAVTLQPPTNNLNNGSLLSQALKKGL